MNYPEKPKTVLFLIRHGNTDWNTTGRLQGQVDVPLDDRGREQAVDIAEWLAGQDVSALYTSNLQRARATADIVSGRIGRIPILDERLREVDAGEWSGKSKKMLSKAYPDAWKAWRAGKGFPPNGETYQHVGKRSIQALHELSRSHLGECVVLVTHSGVIRAILAEVLQRSLSQLRTRVAIPPASTTTLTYDNLSKRYEVTEIGVDYYVSH